MLGVELAGTAGVLLAVLAMATVVVALRPLTPRGTLLARRGLPSVIGTRGMMSGAFFCGQAYIVLVLQDRWGYSPAAAGIALTVVGVVWATLSQVQARLRDLVTSELAMLIGATVATGRGHLAVAGRAARRPRRPRGRVVRPGGCRDGIRLHPHRGRDAGRSSEGDRGFNSSALSIADSIGAALALSLCGIGYRLAQEAGRDPFLMVFGVAIVFAVLAVVTAARTRVPAGGASV